MNEIDNNNEWAAGLEIHQFTKSLRDGDHVEVRFVPADAAIWYDEDGGKYMSDEDGDPLDIVAATAIARRQSLICQYTSMRNGIHLEYKDVDGDERSILVTAEYISEMRKAPAPTEVVICDDYEFTFNADGTAELNGYEIPRDELVKLHDALSAALKR